MIVDTLTHVWESPDQLGRRTVSQRRHDPLSDRLLHADPQEHFESLGPVDVALVLSFESRLLEARIPNRLVASYVRDHPDRLIGVAGLDPTAPDFADGLDEAVGRGGFEAVAISPAAQGFHPMDSRVLPLYQHLIEGNLPLIVHPGPCPAPATRMELGQPVLLDELLREFPGLKLMVAGLGSPWIEQTLTLMSKHAGVLANLGGLLRHPWLSYNALILAQEYGVLDRLLFSSDFPYAMPVACIETLYSINRLVQGTNLPTIPRELLRGIVERDALGLLGLDLPGSRTSAVSPGLTEPAAPPATMPADPAAPSTAPSAATESGQSDPKN